MKEFDYDIYDLNEYDYELPEELIAQFPVEHRDSSRLLALNKDTGEYQDLHFYDILRFLKKGDVLVRNNTKVIPARLFGVKKDTGAKVELLILNPIEGIKDAYEVLLGNAKVVKVGTVISIGDNDELTATCLEVRDEGLRVLKFSYQGVFLEVLEKLGRMPLPPYIKTQVSANDRYQTVYAKIEGSAAAPTAGFHFTPEIFLKLKEMGVEVVDVTLHVGLGTFRPVKEQNLLNHKMHEEEYQITPSAAEVLNLAKKEKRRIISVGTTSCRTLEANFKRNGEFKAERTKTDIFIYPGYEFKAIDALITNFHLPKSTLIMLVSALSKREYILAAYEHAVEEKYRFFSFGDAMFIYGNED